MSPRAIINHSAIRSAPLPGEWVQQAACRGMAPTDGVSEHPFFPRRGGWPLAAVICRDCPVLAACRHYALRYPVTGIWGGMDADTRDRWRRRRRKEAS